MQLQQKDRMSTSLSTVNVQEDKTALATRKSSSSHGRAIEDSSMHDSVVEDKEHTLGNSVSSSKHVDDVFFHHGLMDVAEERPSSLGTQSSSSIPKGELSERQDRSEQINRENERGLPVLFEDDSSGSSFAKPNLKALRNRKKGSSGNPKAPEGEADNVRVKDPDEEAFEKLRTKFLKKNPCLQYPGDSPSSTTKNDDLPPKSPRRTVDPGPPSFAGNIEDLAGNIEDHGDPLTPHQRRVESKEELTPSSLQDSGHIYVA
jgi:hypothetical protein